MAGYIVFENIPIRNIIDDISIKYTRNYKTSPYIGGSGSDTNFVSELGRILAFKSICPSYEELENDGSVKNETPISVYRDLSKKYKDKTGVLTSPSHIDLKGNYLCTNFNVVEDTGHNFTIDWEFTEVVPFNSVKSTFRVWGSANRANSTNKSSKTSVKSGNKVNSNTKKLLKSCGALSSSNKPRACVKYLQKFMQGLGYYKKYKVDGIYSKYTTAELKKLQKAKKLKQTGKWDKTTINYFKKKYKIK